MRKILGFAILAVVGFVTLVVVQKTSAAEFDLQSPGCNSGGICTAVSSSNLQDGATGINPAQGIGLNFLVIDISTGESPVCSSGKQIFHAVKHYIAGGPSYDYQSGGAGADFSYQFNSGIDQQKNRYVGVFYCWTTNLGNDKGSIDTILSSGGTIWQTPEFNLTTLATTIDPVCSQITDCSKYPVINDCTGNRCKLTPSCQWKNNACIKSAVAPVAPNVPGTPGGYSFEIKNPIGVTDFQDLINIIGRWIFNLAIPIAVIMIIWGGVQMLTAGAFPKQFDKGRETVKWAVIGLAVVLIGKGFVTLVVSILNLGKK